MQQLPAHSASSNKATLVRPIDSDGVVQFQHPHHVFTQPIVGEYYATKESLLKGIKARLQIVYDARRITREEYVAIAKNTYRILLESGRRERGGEAADEYFSPSWNDQFMDTALKLQLELLGVMWPPVVGSVPPPRAASNKSTRAATSSRSQSTHLNSSALGTFIGSARTPQRSGTPREQKNVRSQGAGDAEEDLVTTYTATQPTSCASSRRSSVGPPSTSEPFARQAISKRVGDGPHDSGTPLGRIANEGTRPPTPDGERASRAVSVSSEQRLAMLRRHHQQLALEGALQQSASMISKTLPAAIRHAEELRSALRAVEEKEDAFRLRICESETAARTALQGACLSRLVALLSSLTRRNDTTNAIPVSPAILACDVAVTGAPHQGAPNSDPISSRASSRNDSPPPPQSTPPVRSALVADDFGGLGSPPPKYRELAFSTPTAAPLVPPAPLPTLSERIAQHIGRPLHSTLSPRHATRLTPEGLRALYRQQRLERSGPQGRTATPPMGQRRGERQAPTSSVRTTASKALFADPYGPIGRHTLAAVPTHTCGTPKRTASVRGRIDAPASIPSRPAMPTTHFPSRDEVVEHVRALLQPAYNSGMLSMEAFAAIVRHVSTELSSEGIPPGYSWRDVVSMLVQEGCEGVGLC